MEPGSGLSWTALVLWQLGYPDQALKRSQAARTLAQELSYPLSLAGDPGFLLPGCTSSAGKDTLTQEWAEAAMTPRAEQGFPGWLGRGTILQGWALAEQGQVEEGIAQMCQGLATCQAIGVGTFRRIILPCWPRRMGKQGRPRRG